MKIFEFLMNNIYFVAIGLFFLFRVLNSGKGKGAAPGRMPTFGGAGEADNEQDPGQQARPIQPTQGQRPWPGSIGPDGRGSPPPSVPWPGSVTPQSDPQRQPDNWMGRYDERQDGGSVVATPQQPQQQVYRTQSQPDSRPERDVVRRESLSTGRQDIRGGRQERSVVPVDKRHGQRNGISSVAQEIATGKLTHADMRKAVIWAEVLGPPRSKRRLR